MWTPTCSRYWLSALRPEQREDCPGTGHGALSASSFAQSRGRGRETVVSFQRCLRGFYTLRQPRAKHGASLVGLATRFKPRRPGAKANHPAPTLLCSLHQIAGWGKKWGMQKPHSPSHWADARETGTHLERVAFSSPTILSGKQGCCLCKTEDSEFLAGIMAWDMGGACLSLTSLLTSCFLLSLISHPPPPFLIHPFGNSSLLAPLGAEDA